MTPSDLPPAAPMAEHDVPTPTVGSPVLSGAQGRRVPDFFLVGQPKCGTTALYEMLKRHPQIFMPAVKEPGFFASDLRDRHEPPRTPPERLDDYLSLFEPAEPEQRVGEATAVYLFSQVAASHIKALQPAARIIAIVREPASLLRSLHLQHLKTHIETEKSLRQAMRLEADRRAGRSSSPRPQVLLYSDHVRYVEQLRRYHAAFPKEQVLVLVYDDFRQNNEMIAREVLRFLDVDDSLPLDEVEANPTVRVRSRHLDGLVDAVSLGRGPVSRCVKATVKTLTPQSVRRRAMRATRQRLIYGTPPPPDESLMIELRRRFKPEVVALSEYLDRDFVTLWGYDSVA